MAITKRNSVNEEIIGNKKFCSHIKKGLLSNKKDLLTKKKDLLKQKKGLLTNPRQIAAANPHGK